MRKLGRAAIQSIIERAVHEFLNDDSAPELVSFSWKGHYVEATFEWSNLRSAFYVSSFCVVYSRSVMIYKVNEDYNICFAWCW